MKLPSEGTIITLSNFLQPDFRAKPSQFVVAIVADFLPHPGAHLQILQNAAHAQRLSHSIFMPHWPQPNLIPRDPNRGPHFETLAYFGDTKNLAPELRSSDFQAEIYKTCGLQLSFRGPERWHDYSDIDAVLAVRDFSRALHLHKPATKLYNAWIAGVPLLTGQDSACEAEGTDGVDYLKITSPQDLLSKLKLLKNDPDFRNKITSSGQKKTASRNRDAVRQMWVELVKNQLPAMRKKCESSGKLKRHFFWVGQSIRLLWDRKIRS